MFRWSLFRYVLFGSFLAIAVASLTGLFVAERNIEPAFASILAHETKPTAEAVLDLLTGQDLQAEVQKLAPHIGRRISIIALDGRVLADSDVAPDGVAHMANHLHRPEVEAALAKGWGWHTRQSATVGEKFLYVAVRDETKARIVRIAIPLAEYERAINRIKSGLWTGLAVGGLIALGVAFFVARRLGVQIGNLVRVAKRQADGQAAEFGEHGNVEFEELARALNQMTRQVDQRLRELDAERARLRAVLDNMDEGVILCDAGGRIVLSNGAAELLFGMRKPEGKPLIELTRIPEVVSLSRDVRDATGPIAADFEDGNRSIAATFVPMTGSEGYLVVFHDVTRLKRADRIRRDFVANVSHELRTPLASISGYAESLLEGAIDDPKVARPFVDGIGRNSERLSRLIEDLLDLGRIESGRYPFNPESVSLAEAVDAAAQGIVKLAAKRQKFENRVAPESVVFADKKALAQILVNLIENAAKYSPPETLIWVEAKPADGMLEVSVSDRGQGIPPEDLPRIFERFYRSDKSRNAAGEPGTGLGLAICKHLAQEMGGAIQAVSSGQGTTVSFTLPKQKTTSA